MTNKEFIKRLKNIDMIYKTDENGNVSEIISCGETYENHFKQLEKDLEDYEELKKLMGTPIQDIMKRLKVLEIFKKILLLKIVISVDKVDAEIPSDKIVFNLDELNNEEKDTLWEWLREWLNDK